MKSTKLSKLLALVLALAMIFSVLAGCAKDETPDTPATNDPATTTPEQNDPAATTPEQNDPAQPEQNDPAQPEQNEPATEGGNDTLVVGYSNFSQKFSPFFADSAYDQDVASIVNVGLLGTDREGAIVYNGIEGEVRPYNGTDYTYTGLSNLVVTENADGTVDYDFTIRDDVVFSDGTPLTIDDVIFSMYVLCDPAYDGSSTLYATPIEGVAEYRSGMTPVWQLIFNGLAEGNTESEYYTADDVAAFEAAFTAAGTKFAQEIVDYCAAYGATNATEAAGLWGFELAEGATAADFWALILETYGYDLSDTGINYESAGTSISTFIGDTLLETNPELTASVKTGDSAANISGIIKTGENSLRVRMTEFDTVAVYQLGVTVAPMHYYGDVSLYDYENNMFGFPKGDLSGVKAKTTTPLGAGPFKFVEYTDGIVYFEANENYYLGCPKIQYMRFQECADADKTTGVYSGTFDISDPSISESVVATIKEQNGGEMTGPVITTNAVDNLGYGYVGIQADVVRVGEDSGSEESKNLRKAFATLFSVYRDTVIDSYYGERASVIQYPISNTSWAAPRPADEGYEIAFSTDVDGNQIYTDSMTEEERYAAALEASIGFLKAAGYTWDEASGKFTAAPAGAELAYEMQIPADGVGDHPVFGVVTAASAALANIGIDLQITDLSNSSTLWDALDAGTCPMWAAAWGATVDPDMYQIYHSSNIAGLGGTDSNHYHIADAELDSLILEARTSPDQSFRKATYKQCLDIILDWACEVPMYQRQNVIIFSTERVNVATVTPDITTFWGWMNDIELLELN